MCPSLFFAIGGNAKDILKDLNDCIASSRASLREKKLMKLIPPLNPCSRKYYLAAPQMQH